MPIFVIFIVIPLIELFLFASVSEHIGIWTTIFLAFLTAIIGGGLVKYQGVQTLFSMRSSIDRGEMPLGEIFDGFCIVAAGALLITPGFLTDFIGFSLLFPPLRAEARKVIARSGRFQMHRAGGGFEEQARPRTDDNGEIIEGEYEEINEPHDKLR